MRAAFRTDASLRLGAGHTMRCLTLADALASKGIECHFLTVDIAGNLNGEIRRRGHHLHVISLPGLNDDALLESERFDPSNFVDWRDRVQCADANACASVLDRIKPDWLVVDHYGLDASWQSALSDCFARLMVIDDLADRHHLADLLLDQTYKRTSKDYDSFVPRDCIRLCGSQYALLRPEFSQLRQQSLKRRRSPLLRNLLITMGGTDVQNVTGSILQALRDLPFVCDCQVTVVLGASAPWVSSVNAICDDVPYPSRLLVDVKNMAALMAEADLAFGAAGSTSWERCCLGLPTVMWVLADNQMKVAVELELAGAAQVITSLGSNEEQIRDITCRLRDRPSQLMQMSQAASNIVDGLGVPRVMQSMGV